MTKVFVLIMVLNGYHAGAAIDHVEFSDKQECERASIDFAQHMSVSHIDAEARSLCVAKSIPEKKS